jgi:hypothetical protein
VNSAAEFERFPFLGALFEGFIPAEILKSQANQGFRKELHYFRDQQGWRWLPRATAQLKPLVD